MEQGTDKPKPKKKHGRPRWEPNEYERAQIEGWVRVGCTYKMIAEQLMIDEATFVRALNRDPDLFACVRKAQADGGNKVLQTGYTMATSGKNPFMTTFWLKCKLGWKEPKEDANDELEKEFKLSYSKAKG